MYTKCLYTKCIPYFDKRLYTKFCMYTKFSWHSSFDFVYKMYTKICQNMVYILYRSGIYILYNFCIQNVYTVPCGTGVLLRVIHVKV